MKRPIHTVISKETYDKLKNKYGKGFLNAGIEKAVDIAENKMFTVREELKRIADWVLVEVGGFNPPP